LLDVNLHGCQLAFESTPNVEQLAALAVESGQRVHRGAQVGQAAFPPLRATPE
jgi:hypothetical protein